MNFLNAVQVGRDVSSGERGWAGRFTRQLIWLFLHKVVGWADVDKSGTKWDDPIASASDGATHASNPKILTSATGFGTTATEDVIYIKGLTDSERDGVYMVQKIVDANTIEVDLTRGVHTDGLPLAETGLEWGVYRYKSSGDLSSDNDWYVLGGTGVGGTFHLRSEEKHETGDGRYHFQLSPFGDWDGVGHAWNRTDRLTSETNLETGINSDVSWVWGFADASHAFFFTMTLGQALNRVDRHLWMYVGDINAFHPTEDTNPVVLAADIQTVYWTASSEFELAQLVRMLSGDDTTQITARLTYLSQHGDSSTVVQGDDAQAERSALTGNFIRTPLIVTEESNGYEEMRGTLKSVENGHQSGPVGPVPVGASRDLLRMRRWTMPWNGSKVLRSIP